MQTAQQSAGTVTSIVYQIERLADCVFDIKRHVPDHWDEVASLRDIRQCAVDWEMYLQAERVKRLTVVTARLSYESFRLIGYMAMLHRSDPHAKNSVGAEAAFYFVERRAQRGLIQRNLIRFACERLREKGVQYVRVRNKIAQSNDVILRNLGFEPDETLYVRKI